MPNPAIALGAALLLLGLAGLAFWPRRGLWPRWQQARQNSERVRTEDALKHIHKSEMHGRRPTLESLAGTLQVSTDVAAALLVRMEALNLVEVTSGDFRLTATGREAALHIIRAHRLWERYLADETGYDERQWHEQAERYEHTLQPVEVEQLSSQLGHPTHDPHGDPIPDAEGNYVSHGGQSLNALPLDRPARIVHIEDEPETVYAQLVAEGLYPGMDVRVIEVTPHRVTFWANGDVHILAPVVAANITAALNEPATTDTTATAETDSHLTLAALSPGQQGEVVHISARCRGSERRRMMDLGILPGTLIKAELRSPGGDPIAYRIRGALIALRHEQAQLIHITRVAEATI